MALAIDATSTAKSNNSGTAFSWSHTCTGSELGLIVVIGSSGDVATAVDYNGTAMTKLGEQQEPDTGYKVGMWYLIAPTTGAHDINTTFAAGKAIEVRAISFTGAHQSAMVGTLVTQTYVGAHTSTPSVNAGAATGDIVVDGLVWNHNVEAATETAGAGQTEQGVAASGTFTRCAMSTETGATTVTMSWTMSAITAWAICAISVKPSGSAGGGGSSTITLDDTSSTTSNNTGTSISWQHTTSGSNRALIVGCVNTSQASPSGVTYAGVAMTNVVSRQEAPTGKRVSLWKLSSPTLGTNAVTVSFPSAVGGTFGAASFNACQQTTTSLTRTSDSSVGAGTTNATLTIASTATDLVVGILAATANILSTIGAQQTIMWFDIGATSTILARATYESGSSTVVTSYSLSAAANWVVAATSLIPVVAVAEAQSGQHMRAFVPQVVRRPRRPGELGMTGFMCEEAAFDAPTMPCGIVHWVMPPARPRPFISGFRLAPLPEDVSAIATPTIASSAIFPRISLVPQLLTDQEQWQRQAAAWMAEANQGHLQNIGIITLTANASSTTVTDDRAGVQSFIGFTPRTANASTEIRNGTLYVSAQGNGTFTITHADNAQTDRDFTYSILG